jgi:hypothetical protein
MKITNSQLKQIIKEEIENDDRIVAAIEKLSKESWSDVALTSAIQELSSKMEDLDISVDFLSAAVLGTDPQSISGAQSGVGRAARPTKKTPAPAPDKTDNTMDEVSSEKQRRWACAQKDKSASDRAQSLSAAEAEEMCKSNVEEK